LYSWIENDPGIETRALRAQSGLKATELKKQYDQAITDLQSSMDIVISGVRERFNNNGDKNGWNSTSFETMNHWMKHNNLDVDPIEMQEAKQYLKQWLSSRCNPEAMKFLGKIFSF
jgi:hypothetical protein